MALALVIPLLLAVTACNDVIPEQPDTATWEAQTAEFLWGTIEAGTPYPVIHLPTGEVSIYEESAAVLARQRFGEPMEVAQVNSVVADIDASLDPTSGLVRDRNAAAGPAATIYALRALAAMNRLDALDTPWQQRLVTSLAPLVSHPPAGEDVNQLASSFAIVAFLARHGVPTIAATATEALGNSPKKSCRLTGNDIGAWSAEAEMAVAAGGSCTMTEAQAALVLGLTDQVVEATEAEFSIESLARLRAASVIDAARGAPAGPIRDRIVMLLNSLRTAVALDRVDPRPVPLAIAAELSATAPPTRMTESTTRLIDHAITWGGQFATFQPSVPLFLYVARSILMLDGTDQARRKLADSVHWDRLSAIDRLTLATYLDPNRIDQKSISDAIREHASSTEAETWPTLAQEASIARAALVNGPANCPAEIRAWISGAFARAQKAVGTIASAPPTEFLILTALAQLAEACAGQNHASTDSAMAQIRAAAPGLLSRTVTSLRTDPERGSLIAMQTALEAGCRVGIETPQGLFNDIGELLGRARSHPMGVGIADGRRFAADETFAYLRIRQLLANGCKPAGPCVAFSQRQDSPSCP
jgi:hypothetical protein